LKPVYEGYEHFYVLNDKAMLPADMQGRTYFIAHSERDWKFVVNLWEAFQILRKEKPDAILSTGAGPVVPFAIVGRLVFGTRVLFVETITRIKSPSLTGRMMYWLAHDFFYQWETLRPFFSKARYGGPLV
jgi:UDP-N-acetylglucosamine:LPS N-acetylglucosamine transferase